MISISTLLSRIRCEFALSKRYQSTLKTIWIIIVSGDAFRNRTEPIYEAIDSVLLHLFDLFSRFGKKKSREKFRFSDNNLSLRLRFE